MASPSTRRDLKALRRLINQADLSLALVPEHPSIASARESLNAALALSKDLVNRFADPVKAGHPHRKPSPRRFATGCTHGPIPRLRRYSWTFKYCWDWISTLTRSPPKESGLIFKSLMVVDLRGSTVPTISMDICLTHTTLLPDKS